MVSCIHAKMALNLYSHRRDKILSAILSHLEVKYRLQEKEERWQACMRCRRWQIAVADVQSHDKSQTLGTQIQNIGTQVIETMQALGTQGYE
jgi:hypothetical protein